jgi:hypothetical protein
VIGQIEWVSVEQTDGVIPDEDSVTRSVGLHPGDSHG